MNTKENQRSRLSKLLFKKALFGLLDEGRTVEKISVRELCEQAELNRSTFYAHYTEPRDILLEAEDSLLETTAANLREIGQGKAGDVSGYLASFLRYIRENDASLRTLLLTSADPAFRGRFMQLAMLQLIGAFDVRLEEKQEQYVFSYLMNGSLGLILQWLRADYAMETGEVVRLLLTLNKSALTQLAK